MSGLTARVQLVSNALILLGDRPIASLTEETVGATLGANLFENTYLTMLQSHRWRFAVKTVSLSKLSATPDTGYTTAFQLPSDFLYTIKTDANNFEVYGTQLHCNYSSLQLDYIYRVDEDKLPAYFAKALEYNLSAQFAVPITGDLNKADYFAKVFVNELKKAKHTDATQYPEVAVQSRPYVDIRY